MSARWSSERSDNGAWPVLVVPYFDPDAPASAAPSEGEATLALGHLDTEWPVKSVRPGELEGELVIAESAFPAADELA